MTDAGCSGFRVLPSGFVFVFVFVFGFGFWR
jgi:hypothetical protein